MYNRLRVHVIFPYRGLLPIFPVPALGSVLRPAALLGLPPRRSVCVVGWALCQTELCRQSDS